MNIRPKRYLVVILLLIIGACLLFSAFIVSRESFDTPTVQLVVSRYNESLDWLGEAPFNQYPNTIYNKSDNADFYSSPNTETVVTLKNVGRCDHTYLYHIVANYDRLADITVFLPGSVDMDTKHKKATRLLKEIDERGGSVFLCAFHRSVKDDLYNFHLNEWRASNEKNAEKNPEQQLELAAERPFGKWYESRFGDIVIQHVSYSGIFSVSKTEVLQHPKSYYERWMGELENSSNLEVGHYFERSWEAVFYPMNETVFVNE